MTCDWCDEPIGRHLVVQRWTLRGEGGDDENEEFKFCCYTCLMRWVNL
jgi:hypothetical protein